MISEVEVFVAFEAELPSMHFIHFERIVKVMINFLIDIFGLLFVMCGKPVTLNLLEGPNLDPAANDPQVMVRFAVSLLLHYLIPQIHQFLSQDPAFNLQFKIFSIFFFGDVLLVNIDASIYIFDAVLIELIEPEQRFIGR